MSKTKRFQRRMWATIVDGKPSQAGVHQTKEAARGDAWDLRTSCGHSRRSIRVVRVIVKEIPR